MPGTARVGRRVRNDIAFGADEGAATPADGSGATSHICERIQWRRQFRQAVSLIVILKPRDTEVPSAGAIRASLENSTSILCFPLLKKDLSRNVV